MLRGWRVSVEGLRVCVPSPSALVQAVDLIATVIHLSRPCALMFLRDSGVVAVSQLLRLCPSKYLTPELFHAVVRLVCAVTGSYDPNGSSPHDVSRAVSVTAPKPDCPSWAPWFGEAGSGADVPGYASRVSLLAHSCLLYDFKLWGRSDPVAHISILGLLLQYSCYNPSHVRAAVSVRTLLEALRTQYYFDVEGGGEEGSGEDFVSQPGLEPRLHFLSQGEVAAMRRQVLDIVMVLVHHSRLVRAGVPQSLDMASFLLSPSSATASAPSGEGSDASYSSTVGPILSFLQSRVPDIEVVDVLEKLFTLLPLRQAAGRGTSVPPSYDGGSAHAAPRGAQVTPTGMEDVDPALLIYLASVGHAAGVWAVLQRNLESARLLALKFISRYELLQRNMGRGFCITPGHAVFLYRALSPFPVNVQVYRGVFSLLVGADATHVIATTVAQDSGSAPGGLRPGLEYVGKGKLPDPIATMPIQHPPLAPFVWKLLARSDPRVQATGLRDWTCLLVGMDDDKFTKVASKNREVVKLLPDWVQWFLGMTLPPSLAELYQPSTGTPPPRSPLVDEDRDAQLAIVVQQLCGRLCDAGNTVPVGGGMLGSAVLFRGSSSLPVCVACCVLQDRASAAVSLAELCDT